VSNWLKLPPGALEAAVRDARRGMNPGDTAQLHDVGCASQVGEKCNCEPILITAESEQS
jgi:hypothetical protein